MHSIYFFDNSTKQIKKSGQPLLLICPHYFTCKAIALIGAGEGSRTLLESLGSSNSTDEPHLHNIILQQNTKNCQVNS